ncbi:MAG: hypothetical protein ACYTF8_02270 [Planctomycetota bacterium]|jgi:hypothetical protein
MEVLMGLFDKAKAKTKDDAANGGAKRKATRWLCGTENEKVAESVKVMVGLKADMKALQAKEAVHKAIILKFANESFLQSYCDSGIFPDTPMLVQNTDGEKVTFVVQDRSRQYAVKPEQEDELKQILGEDAAEDLIYEETTLSFNRDVLALEGVSEVVEKALERAITKLVKDEVLDEDKAGELVSANVKRSFKPGTLARLGIVCGRDTTRMESVLDAMGSSATRYIKS